MNRLRMTAVTLALVVAGYGLQACGPGISIEVSGVAADPTFSVRRSSVRGICADTIFVHEIDGEGHPVRRVLEAYATDRACTEVTTARLGGPIPGFRVASAELRIETGKVYQIAISGPGLHAAGYFRRNGQEVQNLQGIAQGEKIVFRAR
jgi:hypothetical protein